MRILHPATLACVLPLLAVAGCGLFRSEPKPPGLAAVREARADDAEEWGLLAEAWEAYAEDPQQGVVTARQLAADNPDSVRLAVLAQDLAVAAGDPAIQRELARRRWQESGAPRDAFLFSRLVVDRAERRALLEEAVAGDPDLLQAELALLSMRARAGNPEVLESLLRLLRREPGLAEGWRLLAEVAAQAARTDLVRAAVATEPWSPFDDPARAVLARAQAALRAGDAAAALADLQALPGEHREANLARAAALADLGRPRVAADLLLALLAKQPDDPVVLFDLGLLERDYFFRPAEAKRRFEAYLAASAARGGGDLLRRAQAELWIAEAEEELGRDAGGGSR